MTHLHQWVRDWWVTLRALRDPKRRAVLLGDSTEADYVRVSRPGRRPPYLALSDEEKARMGEDDDACI